MSRFLCCEVLPGKRDSETKRRFSVTPRPLLRWKTCAHKCQGLESSRIWTIFGRDKRGQSLLPGLLGQACACPEDTPRPVSVIFPEPPQIAPYSGCQASSTGRFHFNIVALDCASRLSLDRLPSLSLCALLRVTPGTIYWSKAV